MPAVIDYWSALTVVVNRFSITIFLQAWCLLLCFSNKFGKEFISQFETSKMVNPLVSNIKDVRKFLSIIKVR